VYTPNQLPLGPAGERLRAICRELPEIRLIGNQIAPNLLAEIHRALAAEPELCTVLRALAANLAVDNGSRGYVIVDGAVSDPNDLRTALKIATVLCTTVGSPFRMVRRLDLWQEVPVDLEAVPYRFGGTAHNPLHIDGVNTTRPPDYLAMLGVRLDPAGGGWSLVSHLQYAVRQLSPEAREYLSRPVFVEGHFYDLEGVGEEHRPFAVLKRAGRGMWAVRVTGKMLPDMPPGPARTYLQELVDLLTCRQERFLLRPGQLLLVNQALTAHGREPLGAGQERIPAALRRSLQQSFVRVDPHRSISQGIDW
jgi:hypothetical protein